MAVHGWRPRLTSASSIIIIAGTLAALNSSRQYHCATCPNSGSEEIRGLTMTQDSRDSFIDSGCPIHMVADEMLVDRSSELLGCSSERMPERVIGCSPELMPNRSSELPGAPALTGRSFESFYCASALTTFCPPGLTDSASARLACPSELLVQCSSERTHPSPSGGGRNRDVDSIM